MQPLYTLGVRFYSFLILCASFFNPKAKKWIRGRKNWRQNIPDLSQKEVIWFHCASLGEFDQGLPLMNKIKLENDNLFLLVTFFSPSGFENYTKRPNKVDYACYLPLDTNKNATDFISLTNPSKAFFIKYEFWANFINAAHTKKVEIYNVSGIFWESHRFFKWYGGFFRQTLERFDHFFVQNEASKSLLESINIKNVSVSGDSRYDRVVENKKKVLVNSIIKEFGGNKDVFLIGSSWPIDEEILIKFCNKRGIKTIIAPHDISESHIQSITNQLDENNQRLSNLIGKIEILNPDSNFLILDTIGHLTSAFSIANIAYIGGGFSGKLHNILEPGVYGIPIIIGPKFKKFPEASEFLEIGAAKSISNYDQLEIAFDELIKNKIKIKSDLDQLYSKKTGSTKLIFDHIFTAN